MLQLGINSNNFNVIHQMAISVNYTSSMNVTSKPITWAWVVADGLVPVKPATFGGSGVFVAVFASGVYFNRHPSVAI